MNEIRVRHPLKFVNRARACRDKKPRPVRKAKKSPVLSRFSCPVRVHRRPGTGLTGGARAGLAIRLAGAPRPSVARRVMVLDRF